MKDKRLKYSLILLLAAAIWGFAFVAQRIGSRYIGSFTFNGVRFALGGISLIPLIMFDRRARKDQGESSNRLNTVFAGILAGCILFFAASLQQIGLVDTTAGKAAFITGLYIVLVPIFGVFLKHKIYFNMWVGAAVAVAGLYLLSVTENFVIARGDLLELAGAFLWAVHILLIDRFIKKVSPLKLSFIQFFTCSVLSLIVALFYEQITLAGLYKAAIPILYGGVFSVGVAYTLQVIGQKYVKPSQAAILLSMETVFATLGGFLILNENLGTRGYIGCALMLLGVTLSQLSLPQKAEEGISSSII